MATELADDTLELAVIRGTAADDVGKGPDCLPALQGKLAGDFGRQPLEAGCVVPKEVVDDMKQ